MKNYKIIGAGGTGKSYLIKNMLNSEKYKDLNYLLLSYTHSGKSSYVEGSTNTLKYKTCHSFLFSNLQRIKEYVGYHNLLYFFNFFNNLHKIASFTIDENKRLEVLYKHFKKKLKLKEKEKYITLLDLKEKREYEYYKKLSKLSYEEKKFLIMLTEPTLFDTGYIINPFKKSKVMPKDEYVITKYKTLIGETLNSLLDLKEELLSNQVEIPLNMVYLFRLLVEKDLSKIDLSFYDLIIFEEAQDIPSVVYDFIKKNELARKIIMVGDPYQSIYMDLGYNSYFPTDDFFTKTMVMKKIRRYSESYLLFIKNVMKRENVTLDVLKGVVSEAQHKTYFKEEEIHKLHHKMKIHNYYFLVANNTRDKRLPKHPSTYSTHSVKGKTLDYVIYVENKGLFYLVEKETPSLSFYSLLLKYVGLTRVKKKIIYYREF